MALVNVTLEPIEMKRYLLLLLALPVMAFAAESLCALGEKPYFTCETAKHGRLISLCGSSQLKKGDGYLQYRYGTKENAELTYPPSKAGSIEKFRYAHYFRYQNDQTQVSFSNGGFNYSVFTYSDGEGKRSVEEQGVLIVSDVQPGKEMRVLCKRPAKHNLPDLESVLPCDEENALASCK
jgi:hypothetical protein